MVGVNGVEPLTPRLSSACSNQLSYTPKPFLNFEFRFLIWQPLYALFPIKNPKSQIKNAKLVELRRLELPTYSLQSYRSTN
jgi:hypothetical protein